MGQHAERLRQPPPVSYTHLDVYKRQGLTTLALNLTILGMTYALATQAGLLRVDRIAVVTECGLQNSALGITVCLTWLHSPAMSAPSVVYALLMNAGALVFVMLMRKTERH